MRRSIHQPFYAGCEQPKLPTTRVTVCGAEVARAVKPFFTIFFRPPHPFLQRPIAASRVKMTRDQAPAMTQTASPPPQSAAISAFLRGVERRAQLLASIQTGDMESAHKAVVVAVRVFTQDADKWPIPQWPLQFWRLLLSTPAMGRQEAGSHSPLPGVTRLPPTQRAAVLLHLVAALQEADAAGALGIDVAHYQQRIREALPKSALGQPDLDVWRAWSAAAQRALDKLPDAPTTAPAVSANTAEPPRRTAPPHPQARSLRWLWLALGLLAAAFLATFFINTQRQHRLQDSWFPNFEQQPLPETNPKARFDPNDATLDPDRAMLVAPQELRLALQLPLLAWLSVEAGDPAQPAAGVEAAARTTPWPPALPAWPAPPVQRIQLRDAWAQWQQLSDSERQQLCDEATRFAALTDAQRQALLQRYAQLPFDAHRGWHLGPQLGRAWPRIAALFTYIAPAERNALLQLLRSLSPDELETLARLAQTIPPEARAQFRTRLLAQHPAQRAAWLQARLQR